VDETIRQAIVEYWRSTRSLRRHPDPAKASEVREQVATASKRWAAKREARALRKGRQEGRQERPKLTPSQAAKILRWDLIPYGGRDSALLHCAAVLCQDGQFPTPKEIAKAMGTRRNTVSVYINRLTKRGQWPPLWSAGDTTPPAPPSPLPP
jgi:hypothetical protein